MLSKFDSLEIKVSLKVHLLNKITKLVRNFIGRLFSEGFGCKPFG